MHFIYIKFFEVIESSVIPISEYEILILDPVQ